MFKRKRETIACFPAAVTATLVLREMQEQQLLELKHNPAAFTESCDVAAFVFDSSSVESFQAAHQLLLHCAELAQDNLPCMLIAAKDDLGISMVSSGILCLLSTAYALTCISSSLCKTVKDGSNATLTT